MLNLQFFFSDVAQGNFSEEMDMSAEIPIQKEKSAAGKDHIPLRPELSSTGKILLWTNYYFQ